jgi:hypothetical protein
VLTLVHKRVLLRILYEAGEGHLQLVQSGLGQLLISQQLLDRQDETSKLGQRL